MKSKFLAVIFPLFLLTACGSNQKNFSVNVLSDPLGAYALMKVTYDEQEESDWIFLGPTPIDIQKNVAFSGAKTVSLKVIRPGFYEQTKSWKAKDFLKQHKASKKIIWVPNLVKQ